MMIKDSLYERTPC